MEQAIIGVFASAGEARAARDELFLSGFQNTNVRSAGSESDASVEEGGIAGFFQALFGTDDHPHVDRYSTAAEGGHTVVMVKAVSDAEADRAIGILENHGAIDVHDEDDEQLGAAGNTLSAAAARTSSASGRVNAASAAAASSTRPAGSKAMTDTQKIPVVEEQLAVGKRKVERGGVRVYMRETERPVEATVNLKEERVIVERRPVQRPATADELTGAKERVFEVRTTGEVPIVSKTAKVVEEVEIGRVATERKETVRDSVKRTDVEVEKIDPASRRTPGKV
jgi:uncharacterized protein (TIGR02271 family)